MSSISEHKKILEQFLRKYDRRRRFVHYDYQELGLYLAHKLNEWDKRSFYIRIARDEDRALVQQALMYAADLPENKRAKGFLWRLKELKSAKKYRAFVGVFLSSKESSPLVELINDLNKRLAGMTNVRITPLDKLHITLYFWGALAGQDYPRLVRAARSLREKYNTPVRLTFNAVDLVNDRYLWLVGKDPLVFRMYYSLPKFIRDKNAISRLFGSGRKSITPHVTLVRIKQMTPKLRDILNNIIQEWNARMPLIVEGEPYFVTSRLTSEGPIYKIHKDT